MSEIRVPEGETVDVGPILAVVSDGAAATGGPVPTTASTAPAEAPTQEPAPTPPAPPVVAQAPTVVPEPSTPPGPTGSGPRASCTCTRTASALARRRAGPRLGSRADGASVGQRLGPCPLPGGPPPDQRAPDGPCQLGRKWAGRPDHPRGRSRCHRRAQASSPTRTAGQASPAVTGRTVAPAPAAPASLPLAGTDEVIPFTNIRRRTAEHMVRSKATSPHTLVVLEADYENVERTRRSEGNAFKAEEGFSLTYLPFVARSTVEALHEWPNLNSSVGDDSLIVHHGINLGIAVDLDHQGLIVPVVHGAEELTLRGMARRIRDISTRARSKQLNMDDISGGTFSLTNAGPFGTFLTAPIINQPQVAILSTDGVKRRPVVVNQPDGTEAIAIHSVGLLCLSWDHRAVDGAYAAAFLARVVEILGTRDWSAEL